MFLIFWVLVPPSPSAFSHRCAGLPELCTLHHVYNMLITLKVTDTSERDRALAELGMERAARRKAELEMAQMRLRYEIVAEECATIKKELDRRQRSVPPGGFNCDSSESTGFLCSCFYVFDVPVYTFESCVCSHLCDLAPNSTREPSFVAPLISSTSFFGRPIVFPFWGSEHVKSWTDVSGCVEFTSVFLVSSSYL